MKHNFPKPMLYIHKHTTFIYNCAIQSARFYIDKQWWSNWLLSTVILYDYRSIFNVHCYTNREFYTKILFLLPWSNPMLHQSDWWRISHFSKLNFNLRYYLPINYPLWIPFQPLLLIFLTLNPFWALTLNSRICTGIILGRTDNYCQWTVQ